MAGILIVTFIGLILGSFATALSYRIPREQSIITKTRSECTSCGRKLTAIDLIPIFSWLFLIGKCRTCKSKIGIRYPLIELGTVSLCLLFYYMYGFSFNVWPMYLLAPMVVSMIAIDLEYKIIPDSLNFSVLLLGILLFLTNASLYASPISFAMDNGAYLWGGLAMYGLGMLAFRQIAMFIMKREPMGLGDIKLFAAIGVWLGTSLEAFSLFLFVSGLSGIILAIIWKYEKGEREFPFGPSIIVGFITTMCVYPIVYL